MSLFSLPPHPTPPSTTPSIAPLTPSSDKALEITNLFIVDQKPENDSGEEGEKSVEIDEIIRAPTYDARPKFSILDRIVNRHKPLRTEMEVAEDSDEDFEGSGRFLRGV